MPDLWPYVPLPDIQENLVWETDIRRAQSAEVREALHSGRQYLKYTYRISAGFQRALSRLRAAPNDAWFVPIWHQSSKAGAVLSADTSLAVDLSAEYTDKAVIFDDCDNYVIVDIAGVTATLDLVAPVGQDFANPTVAPIRSCVPVSGAETARESGRHSTFSIEFLSDERFAASGGTYTVLSGLPFYQCSVATKRVPGSLLQPAELFDSGIGGVELVDLRDFPDIVFGVNFVSSDRQEVRDFRNFLGDLRGRDGAFWVADWEGRLSLTAPLSSGATQANFTGIIDDPADYVGRYVFFGSEGRTVVTASNLGAGVHSITFASLTVGSSSARLLRKVRLNSDRLSFQHRRGFTSDVSFSAIEVAA